MTKLVLAVACLLIAACSQPVATSSPSVPEASPSPSADATAPNPASDNEASGALPFSVTCGPMDPVRCQAYAQRIADEAGTNYPGKTIAGMTIESANGSFYLLFTDGSGAAAIVN